MVDNEVGGPSRALTLSVFFASVGCAVDPNFHAPSAPAVDVYLKDTVPAPTAQLLPPVFHGGPLRAQKRAADASLDNASAGYQAAALSAFPNVPDSLRALEPDAENLRAPAQAKQSAARSLDLAREQYQGGAADYLQLLDATRQNQRAHIGLIQARADRLGDTAALYTALGGGRREGAAREITAAAITPLP